MELLLPVLTTAVSIGLGCGSCCSPTVSVFLSTYIISHAGGMKKSLLAFLSFISGKVTSVMLLCLIAALAGNQFINDSGYLGSLNLKLVMQLIMFGIGCILIIKWFLDHKTSHKKCKTCTGHKKIRAKGILPLFTAGFAYGATPCAPLLLIIGLCTTLSISSALLVGLLFTLASTVTPVLLMVLVSGLLSGRIIKEIPQYLKWFQLASYVLITVLSITSFNSL